MRKTKWTAESIQDYLNQTESGCVLISKDFKILKDKLKFQCKCGNIFERKFYNLVNQKSYYCHECSLKMKSNAMTFTHEEYLNKLKANHVDTIIPVEKYINSQTNILHKCTICGNEWSVRPSNILSGFGCPNCAKNRVMIGVNDMWTTVPELAQCLKNPDDGFKYTKSSKERVDFICPDCGAILKSRVINHTYYNGGLKCPYCSDGLSMPNKFMSNILQYCGIEYDPEHIFEWAKNKRYDFYLPSYNIIIEIMGGQHYQENNFISKNGRTLKEEQLNDKEKMELAQENGISNYYQIDFRYSDCDYMIKSICATSLFKTLKIDISKVELKHCYKKALRSRLFEAVDYWNSGLTVNEIYPLMKVSNVTVINYLNQAHKLGLCDYAGFKNRYKPVRCITTNKIFESIKSASEYYGVSSSHIRECCLGKRYYSGVDYSNNKLVWEFVTKDKVNFNDLIA